MSSVGALRVLRRPWPWAALAGLGLVVALSVSSRASGWIFWGATALSCLGAFVATWVGGSEREAG